MSTNLSVYLDLLRLVAASLVFIGHARGILFPDAPIGILSGHAGEAVIAFFVLSGFVIQFVVAEKETNITAYLLARLSRVYSVVLIALPVTLLADLLGAYLSPAYYAEIKSFTPETIESAVAHGRHVRYRRTPARRHEIDRIE